MRSSLVLEISRLILLILLSLNAASAADNRTCYMVDEQTIAVDHVPCTTKHTTHCCHKNDICVSNGLCWSQRNGDMVLSRGSCSNVNWSGDCVSARPCGMLSLLSSTHLPSSYRRAMLISDSYHSPRKYIRRIPRR
jgi:hypothetical protein